VDEVVGHVDVAARAAEGSRIEHVGLVELNAVALEMAGATAVANEASDVDVRSVQDAGETGTYETGGSGYEGTHVGYPVRFPEEIIAADRSDVEKGRLGGLA
jgi:hypothetical protein